MSVYKDKKTGKWRASIRPPGRPAKTISCSTYDEAVTKEAELKKMVMDGVALPKGKADKAITLKDAFWNCYNDTTQEKPWKDTDHGKKQIYYFLSMSKFWGENKLLRDIKKEDWLEFISQFPETATNNRRACCLNKVFRHALEQGTITADNLLKIPRKKEKLTRFVTYSYEQEQAIYKQCQVMGFNDLEDFVKVLIETGCRSEELINLTPKDLMKSKEGWIARVYRRKTDTESTIGLSTSCKEILMRRSNQQRFFMTSYRQMKYKWETIRQMLGQSGNKDWVFHTCRHTCASRLAEAGNTFMEVCDWMGWSPNSPVAKRYIHFFPKVKIKMAKKLDDLRRDRVDLKVINGSMETN